MLLRNTNIIAVIVIMFLINISCGTNDNISESSDNLILESIISAPSAPPPTLY